MASRADGRASRAHVGPGINRVALVDGAVAVWDQLQRGPHRRDALTNPQRRTDAIRHHSALRSIRLCGGRSWTAVVDLCGRRRCVIAAWRRLLDGVAETVPVQCPYAD